MKKRIEKRKRKKEHLQMKKEVKAENEKIRTLTYKKRALREFVSTNPSLKYMIVFSEY